MNFLVVPSFEIYLHKNMDEGSKEFKTFIFFFIRAGLRKNSENNLWEKIKKKPNILHTTKDV
jgi:hypothetical protein